MSGPLRISPPPDARREFATTSAMPSNGNERNAPAGSASDRPAMRPDMSGRPGRLAVEGASRITQRITLLAVFVGLVLAGGKALVFLQSGSVGVLASLVHSGLDMTGAIASFFAVRFAAREAGGTYRYGRGKAEGVAAVFQVCLIVLASVHLFQEAVQSLAHVGHDHGFGSAGGHGHAVRNTGFAMVMMLGLVWVTLLLVIAQTWAVRATGSLAVRGDRAHYTADLLANLAVIAGLGLTAWTGIEGIDAAVGVGFALWLFWTAWRVAHLAWNQLMDRELPGDERDYLHTLARMDGRVQGVRELRTRAAGPHVHIQMQVDLDDALLLTEAHAVCVAVEQRIRGLYRAAQVSVLPHPVDCGHDHGSLPPIPAG